MAAKPRTIDEYLAGLSPDDRAALQNVRRAVHAEAPGAEKCISYGMPAFRLTGRYVAGFKAAARHRSFHPMSGDTVATLSGRNSPGTTRAGEPFDSLLALACQPHSFAN